MSKLKNTIVLLFGHTGIGKYTIAQALAPMGDFILLDNHYFNNPVFNLIELDGKSSLPQAVRGYTRKIRQIVLDVVKDLSPQRFNFIFTNVMYNEDPHDTACYEEYVKLAEARNAKLFPVQLVCDTEEMSKRVVNPERKKRMKLVDVATAHKSTEGFTLLNTGHPNAFSLDITRLTAQDAAEQIMRKLSHAA